ARRPAGLLLLSFAQTFAVGAVLGIDGRERAALDDERPEPAAPIIGDARVDHDHGASVVRMLGDDAGPGRRVAEDHALGSQALDHDELSDDLPPARRAAGMRARPTILGWRRSVPERTAVLALLGGAGVDASHSPDQRTTESLLVAFRPA